MLDSHQLLLHMVWEAAAGGRAERRPGDRMSRDGVGAARQREEEIGRRYGRGHDEAGYERQCDAGAGGRGREGEEVEVEGDELFGAVGGCC